MHSRVTRPDFFANYPSLSVHTHNATRIRLFPLIPVLLSFKSKLLYALLASSAVDDASYFPLTMDDNCHISAISTAADAKKKRQDVRLITSESLHQNITQVCFFVACSCASVRTGHIRDRSIACIALLTVSVGLFLSVIVPPLHIYKYLLFNESISLTSNFQVVAPQCKYECVINGRKYACGALNLSSIVIL